MSQPTPLPDTKVITLLEENKLNQGIDDNGTFSINLKEQVILREGDSIELTNAFIDTTPSEETFIEVGADETEITVKHGIYLTDTPDNENAGADKPSWGRWSDNVAYRPDAKKYILSNEEPAFGNTFFEWTQSNNTFAPPSTSLFTTEIQALVPEENTGFEYVVNAVIPDDAVAEYPASTGLVLDTKYYMGGHMILKPTFSTDIFVGGYEFYYYPRGYTPAGSEPAENDHTAVFKRWTDSVGNILGWRAIANPNTTETIEERKWLFQSDFEGYNYFSTGGKSHMVQLNSILLPVNLNWIPEMEGGNIKPGFPEYAGLDVQYVDPRTNKTHVISKIFNNGHYDIITNKQGVVIGGGMDAIAPEIKPFLVPYEQRPPEFKIAQYGWGQNSGWEFYRFKQFIDPYDTSSPQILPKIVFSIDDPPQVKYYFYTPEGKGIDTGFVNTKSQFFRPNFNGSVVQPSQLTDTSPVINPDETGTTLVPREYTSTFTIPQGKYTNSDFAKLLTDKFNELKSPIVGLSNNPTGENQPLNSAGFSSSYFYQTTYELLQQYDGYSGGAGADPNERTNLTRYPNNYVYSKVVTPERTLSDGTVLAEIPAKVATFSGYQPYWVSEDGESLFQYIDTEVNPTSPSNGTAHGFGASEFSIIFDEEEQAFSIAQAHTPIYNNGATVDGTITNGNQIIKQFKVDAPTDLSFLGTLKSADTSSGIFLTSLEPQSLFFTKMRLDKHILTNLGQQEPKIKDFTGADSSFTTVTHLSSTMVHPVTLNKGINVTGLFNGVDGLVTKKATYFQQQPWGEAIETDTLVSLIGNSFTQSVDDDAFYQIEISGINQQEFYGQNKKNNLIQGIVGKYYSNGNFTQQEGGGLEYTHKGDALSIKSLRVRILDSQGEPQEGLGGKSAVILTLSSEK